MQFCKLSRSSVAQAASPRRALGNLAKFGLCVAAVIAAAPIALASSHREAPFISGQPKVDGTDLYMFRSYETGRQNFVTILANYQPFQDPQGGPNFAMFDPDAL